MSDPSRPVSSDRTFAHRVLIVIGLVVAAGVIVWLLSSTLGVVLLLLAGVLVGVLLNGMANLLRRFIPIPYKASLGLVTLLLLGLFGGFFWYAGPNIVEQAGELQGAVTAGLGELEAWVEQQAWGDTVLERVPEGDEIIERLGTGGAFGQLTGIFSTVLGAAFNVFIVLFIAVYCALNPGVYVNNAIRLFPKHRRERMHDVAIKTAHALKLWLIGQFFVMAFVAVFVTVGLWLLGVPLALTLGVISFLLGFIPYLGPILAAFPALLVAFLVGPEMVLYVALLYFVLEQLQSYIVLPLIQEKVVSLPPVLLIGAQLLFAAFGGLLGVALAAPIAVIVVVWIQMLYVEDALGDDVPIIGQKEGGKRGETGTI